MSEPSPFNAELDRAAAKVAGWLRYLIDPEQVVELRALRVQDGTAKGNGERNGEHGRGEHGHGRGGSFSTWAGCFRGNELEEMARAALCLSGNCQGVYYTLNPLRPERFVRQAPRVQKAGRGQTAEDIDIIERRWLLVDIDPVKPDEHKDDSATAEEKSRTYNLAGVVRQYLAEEGWPAPILCDSGNGHHLLYKLAEPYPVTPTTLTDEMREKDVLRRMLLHLHDRFSGGAGEIDVKVFNPARIVKFPGTLACKGEATEERPHRRARVLEVPES